MSRKAVHVLLLLLAVSSPGLGAAPAATPLVAAAPDFQPGVSVGFTSLATGRTDVRLDRMMALAVPATTPPSSLLAPGPFRAVLGAELTMPLRTDVTFSFEGTGTAELSVNGRVVHSETGKELGTKPGTAVTLMQGTNRLAVTYTSPPAGGDAAFRLIWAGKDFGREPLPPALLRTDAAALPLRTAERIRAGRELFAQLRCVSCHRADLSGDGVMPELRDRAPSLELAGTRFQEAWIAVWIADPRAHRPDTPMPRVSLGAPGDAADIAAYLASFGQPAPAAPAATALVNGGGRLFADLRCIACHPAPGTTPATGDTSRVSLADVPAKWQPAALTNYLQHPQDYFPASRMPDLRLSASEARQLAAFVLAGSAPGPAPVGGNRERGQALYFDSRVGCYDCHGPLGNGFLPIRNRTVTARPLDMLLERAWTEGCLAETPAARRNAPDFGLTAAQRDNLRAFAAAGAQTLAQDAPVEFARRSIAALNCAACHARDGQPPAYDKFTAQVQALHQRFGASAENDAETTALDQEPPSLTWAGEKLRLVWLVHQLAGDLPVSARPWLKARMPSFKSAAAAGLATGLALEHGVLATEAPVPAADPDRIALGERLIGQEAFACIACHAVGSTPALAPFGAPGIDFSLVPARLRGEYFQRWLDNPTRIDPRTKMPKFTSAPGRSLQGGILDGDATAQWDAVMAYLRVIAETEGPSLPKK